jgi:hypothetical protein
MIAERIPRSIRRRWLRLPRFEDLGRPLVGDEQRASLALYPETGRRALTVYARPNSARAERPAGRLTGK